MEKTKAFNAKAARDEEVPLVEVRVCGASELPEHMPWATAIVSIWTPHMRSELPTFRLPPRNVLGLDFDDIEVAHVMDHGWYGKQYPPTRKHIERLVSFTRKLTTETRLLVHCAAGISRSAAATLVVLGILYPNETPKQLRDRLLRVRLGAYPNKAVLRLGDLILGTGKKLQKAGELCE